ncbi:hypothetical protein NEPAR06_1819 [Nematocida parisii]|uniref:U3 small nucleolar RNA-associated protein 11 n=1 Tax=Nematocida parisii (strain ERTm3) TaxID=935791 RepID=I3EJW1_NEMP3|nr:uncharacterized protein NEPG_00964 [Nematocida parisii ERTm1]EIJ89508.1 hypothetical protein NEQG_00278 [Nematocida parisii ERTm3]KAI5127483.1 hypothetical protein NEPAR03_0929 [Nematocida parisii]EIJ94297.1 hypothetical protein NEPG_00964 [Nematocida parisii ERTm1]KAI5130600.1 hypothetical protein NEPAR08_2109 [Nematocida parisii]KAI5144085.1 hypothetical protein NEPAR04_2062 [Nematocida parisii]|eukprot:XP_013058793.1 hypothetical protein NEPG_00964 [Nematocida parisii ERTm1]
MKKRQTNYKERGQLAERRSLGVLEKKRHFLKRSTAEKAREEKIQLIKKLAAESNPDEFNHFMYKYKRSGVRLIRKDKVYEKDQNLQEPEELPEELPMKKPERIIFTE